MRIIGKELQEKLNYFNATHRIDPSCEYEYVEYPEKTPIKEQLELIKKHHLHGSRSYTSEDGRMVLWKPIHEETLVRKVYPRAEEEPESKGKLKRGKKDKQS